jgi:hypothetical protein
MKRTPTSPGKAYHRLMKTLVKTSHGKAAVDPTPKELDSVAKVFALAGGSWEKVFKGSVDDMNLLKKTIKVAVENDVFTKASRW